MTSCRLATLAMPKQKSELALKEKLCYSFDFSFRLNKEVRIRISLISGSEGATFWNLQKKKFNQKTLTARNY
jgi:hypothetical protein